jgi:integrase
VPLPRPHAAESNGGLQIIRTGHAAADPLDTVLRLVLNAVSSPHTRRSYAKALVEFTAWRRAQGSAFTRASVQAWRSALEEKGRSPATINVRLAAIRKLASEAAANGLLDAATALGIQQISGARQRGNRMGNWLSQAQTQALIQAPEPNTLKGKRDRCALALLVGCGLRRGEAVKLEFTDIQQRDGRWVIVDLQGKHGRIRTVPVPPWVKVAIDRWSDAARIAIGRILRSMNKYDQITGETLSGDAVLDLAMHYGAEIGVALKAHDLRRTCAKLCRKHGGELEQIQILLGHASIQTTERYLGTKQDLEHAPNDRLGLRWKDND